MVLVLKYCFVICGALGHRRIDIKSCVFCFLCTVFSTLTICQGVLVCVAFQVCMCLVKIRAFFNSAVSLWLGC